LETSIYWWCRGCQPSQEELLTGFPSSQKKELPRINCMRLEKQTEEIRKKTQISPFIFPHYTTNLLEKQSHDNLHANEDIGKKECLVTTNAITTGRPDVTIGLSN
jgi:hypothetical protein